MQPNNNLAMLAWWSESSPSIAAAQSLQTNALILRTETAMASELAGISTNAANIAAMAVIPVKMMKVMPMAMSVTATIMAVVMAATARCSRSQWQQK